MRISIGVGLLSLLAAIAATPASAQHVVWSANMTAGLYDSSEGSFVGYHPGVGVGSIDNLDFEFRGKAYTIHTLTQLLSGDDTGAIYLRFNPGVLPHSDLETMSLSVDGEPLEVEFYSYSGTEEDPRRAVIKFVDPGWRWEDGQATALELSTTLQPVPALPLIGAGLLALVLSIAAYRRSARWGTA